MTSEDVHAMIVSNIHTLSCYICYNVFNRFNCLFIVRHRPVQQAIKSLDNIVGMVLKKHCKSKADVQVVDLTSMKLHRATTQTSDI